VVFDLSAALKGEITVVHGRVQQSNFSDCSVLWIDEMPAIEVYIAPGEVEPGGIGEPVASAMANAGFAATGQRIRRLPGAPADLVRA